MSPACSTVFFNSLARSRYFFTFFSALFCVQPGQQSRKFCKFSFFFIIIIKSGLLAEIRWSLCMSKSHRSLCVSFSRTGAGLCIYHLLLFTPQEFFTSVLADGFSLEFEWQQVSSSLQDSSQDSGRPQQCCRLDSLNPSANFQILKAL